MNFEESFELAYNKLKIHQNILNQSVSDLNLKTLKVQFHLLLIIYSYSVSNNILEDFYNYVNHFWSLIKQEFFINKETNVHDLIHYAVIEAKK